MRPKSVTLSVFKQRILCPREPAPWPHSPFLVTCGASVPFQSRKCSNRPNNLGEERLLSIALIPCLGPTVLKKFKLFVTFLSHNPSVNLRHRWCYFFDLWNSHETLQLWIFGRTDSATYLCNWSWKESKVEQLGKWLHGKKITCSASLRTRVQVLRTHINVSRTQKLTFNSGAYKVKTRDLQSKLMAIQSFKWILSSNDEWKV